MNGFSLGTLAEEEEIEKGSRAQGSLTFMLHMGPPPPWSMSP